MANIPRKVILLGTAWPFRGGLAAYNERLAQQFCDMGMQCEIVTFTTQYPKLFFPGKTQFAEEPSAFKKITRKLSSINPITWWTTAQYIKKQKPDLLIVKFWIPVMGPAFGSVLRLLSKETKKICILDNVVPHEKRMGDELFTKYFFKSVQSFIAMSQSVKVDLKTFEPNKKVLINPHPVFDNFGEAIDQVQAKKSINLAENQEYVLFFGFIRKYKGLDLALRAFAKWKKEIPNVTLIVAGEFYDNKQTYMSLASDLGIEKEVVWHTDFIPDSQVKVYFSACSLVLQPYHHATQSGVTQIAYQFEKPMVVTNVGGLPELVEEGKTGYLVEPDADKIAKKVIHFFQKDSNSFESDMKDAKKRFSWSAMVDNILTLYRDLE